MKIKHLLIILLSCISSATFAWENHAAMTQVVLNGSREANSTLLNFLNERVEVESLNQFLGSTEDSLPTELKQIEEELRNEEPDYQPVPDDLTYDPKRPDCASHLAQCFKMALRINLDVPLPFIVFDPHHEYLDHEKGAKKIASATQIMLPEADTGIYAQFTLLPQGTKLKRADVITTATAQPDWGLDLHNYKDNHTSFGKHYGFGTQPIQGETGIFGSQALFHMSTYHDDPELLYAMPRLKEDYPEYRSILYFKLARFAAKTQHPYWSAVFLGWGLHYIQDTTQPYHAVLTNGIDHKTLDQTLLALQKGDIEPLQKLIALQINRHILLEKLSDYLLTTTDPQDETYRSLLVHALTTTTYDETLSPCDVLPFYLRNHVDQRIAKTAAIYQSLLSETLPSSFINDASFHASEYQAYERLFHHNMSPGKRYHFASGVSDALIWFGAYTRHCIAASMPARASGKAIGL